MPLDLKKICLLFRDKLGEPFIEGIERRMGQEFDEALEKRPKDLLVNILQNVEMDFITPYEMCLEVSKYLLQNYGIKNWSLVFSEKYEYKAGERIGDAIKIVDTFHKLIEELGLAQYFVKEKG